MTIGVLLEELRCRNVRLSVKGEQLLVDAPSGTVDEELARAIRQHKPAIISLLRGAGDHDTSMPEPLIRAPEESRCSLTQERIWALDQLDPGSGQFNLPGSWWIHGPIDVPSFEAALEAFAERHEIFRKRFQVRDGRPVMSRPEYPGFEFQSIEIGDVDPHDNSEARLVEWLVATSKEPIDLANGPLLRVFLIKVERDRHLLFLVSHSAVWDAWCYDLFLKELGSLYRVADDAETLVPPDYQYSDFVHWQRERQQSASVAAAVERAVQRLAEDLTRRARLPADRPRADPRNHEGARLNFGMPAELREAAREYARKTGSTPFMVTLTAYAAVISRYVRRDTVVVTIPLRGRDRPEFEDIFGPFTNNLFLPIPVAGHSFGSLLDVVRADIGDALSGEVPAFERLVESLDQDLANSNLFQLQFSYQNIEDRAARWGDGVRITPGPARDFHATHADISYWIRDSKDGVDGAIDYRTAMFDRATIERFADHVFRMLELGIAHPDVPLAGLDIRIGDEIERQRGFSRGDSAPADSVIEALICRAQKCSRGIVCYSASGGSTWRDLMHDVAHTCSELGKSTVPGDPVVIECSPGTASLVGAIAVLAAGRRLVLDDGSARETQDVRLTDAGGAARGAGVVTVSLAADQRVPAVLVPVRGKSLSHGTQTWTSGEIDQACEAYARRFRDKDRRVLAARRALTPELVVGWLAALTSGRSLLMPEGDELEDEFSLGRFIERHAPDYIDVEEDLLAALLSRDQVLKGARYSIRARPGNGQLMTVARDKELDMIVSLDTGDSLGIGLLGSPDDTPLRFTRIEAGIEICVVDDAGHPAPEGIDGRLQLGFHGAARGPASHPITVRRGRDGFVHWPDVDELDRAPADAALEAILNLPQVSDAHVGWRQRAGGKPELIAWIVQRPRSETTNTVLHRALRARLRGIELPKLLINVDHIPRASSGSVIRRNLFDPDVRGVAMAFEPPRKGLEAAFAGIWRNVLKLERISAHDNFANLGGTSVQALVILSETEKCLQWSFEPRMLFFQSLRQIVERAPDRIREGQAG